MFVPDVMHEFELGVWKATFSHLIRLVIECGGDAIQELDRRYVLIATQPVWDADDTAAMLPLSLLVVSRLEGSRATSRQ